MQSHHIIIIIQGRYLTMGDDSKDDSDRMSNTDEASNDERQLVPYQATDDNAKDDNDDTLEENDNPSQLVREESDSEDDVDNDDDDDIPSGLQTMLDELIKAINDPNDAIKAIKYLRHTWNDAIEDDGGEGESEDIREIEG